MKACECGNTEFYAEQRCLVSVVADSDNNFVRGKSGEEAMKFRLDRYRKLLLPFPKWIRVYDNGGETIDRFTVVNTGNYVNRNGCDYLSMSSNPSSPQGVCQHGWSASTIDRPSYKHLGKKISYAHLPIPCKMQVLSDYMETWNLGCPLCRSTNGYEWKITNPFGYEIRLECPEGHRFEIWELDIIHEYTNTIQQIARKIEPKAVELLTAWGKAFKESGGTVVGELGMWMSENYTWYLNVQCPDKNDYPLKMSIYLLEQRCSEDSEDGAGVAFYFEIARWQQGKRKVYSLIASYDYTEQTWINTKDPENVQLEWEKFVEKASVDSSEPFGMLCKTLT